AHRREKCIGPRRACSAACAAERTGGPEGRLRGRPSPQDEPGSVVTMDGVCIHRLLKRGPAGTLSMGNGTCASLEQLQVVDYSLATSLTTACKRRCTAVRESGG